MALIYYTKYGIRITCTWCMKIFDSLRSISFPLRFSLLCCGVVPMCWCFWIVDALRCSWLCWKCGSASALSGLLLCNELNFKNSKRLLVPSFIADREVQNATSFFLNMLSQSCWRILLAHVLCQNCLRCCPSLWIVSNQNAQSGSSIRFSWCRRDHLSSKQWHPLLSWRRGCEWKWRQWTKGPVYSR